MRLNRFMAAAGIASRRKCEALIASGRVRVNGETVTALATLIDPARDVVEFDGVRVRPESDRRVYVLYKPAGLITTLHDPQGRPTIASVIPPALGRVYPVGRLDRDTTGLILLTDDGDLAYRVTHPSHHVPKRYLALVAGCVSAGKIERLVSGVRLDDGPARARAARRIATDGRRSVLEIVLGEGRKRQVRRMLEHVGHPVDRLHRSAIGPVELGDLAEGEVRVLDPGALARLRDAVGLDTT